MKYLAENIDKIAFYKKDNKVVIVEMIEEGPETSLVRLPFNDAEIRIQSSLIIKDHCLGHCEETNSVCQGCAGKDVCKSVKSKLQKINSKEAEEHVKVSIVEEVVKTEESTQYEEAVSVVKSNKSEIAISIKSEESTQYEEAVRVVKGPKVGTKVGTLEERRAKVEAENTVVLTKSLVDSERNTILIKVYSNGSYIVEKNQVKITATKFFKEFLTSKQIQFKPNAETRDLGKMVVDSLS